VTDAARATAGLAAPPLSEPLFLRACRGEAVERTPVWIMRQAGRYLPEYRALRERYDFLTACRTPELACEITLQPVRRLGVDAAILFSDILVPLPGMGVEVAFTPGPTLARTIRSDADIDALLAPDAREATPYVLDAIRATRRALPPGVPLIGFAGAPFTMAAYLVEGGGSRAFSHVKHLLFARPDAADRLLDVCTRTVASYLTAQVSAGAQAAMLFDTWAGLLGPQDIGTFVLPYVRRIFQHVRATTTESVPLIYYAGDAAGWLELAADTGADVVGLDWRLRLDAARTRLGPRIVLQGNLDPATLLGPPAFIRARVADVLTAARGSAGPGPTRAHVFNLGHGILPDTPPEHAEVLVDAVREFTEIRT
jgi:uroporphyrinogen decarboxylase